jgi:hypothetical protein
MLAREGKLRVRGLTLGWLEQALAPAIAVDAVVLTSWGYRPGFRADETRPNIRRPIRHPSRRSPPRWRRLGGIRG